MRNRFTEVALRTSLLYAGIAALWILLSNKLLHALVSDPVAASHLELYKGWAFVMVTAWLLYWGLRGQMRHWERETIERKRIEASLLLFRALIDQTKDGIEVVDPETCRFLDVNEKTCLDLGYTREEMLSLTVSDIDPKDPPTSHAEILKELRQWGFVTVEGVHRRKDGTTFPVELSMKLVRLDRDYVVTVARDITERKAAENVLRENEARLATIFHHSPLGIVITRFADGKILDANDAFASIHGCAREELIGHTSMELQLWDRPCERDEMVKRLREQETCKDLEIKCRKRTGETGYLLLSVELIELGGERCMLGMARDITERKRAEEAYMRLATAVDQAAEDIVITDATGKIVYVNPAFEKISGYQRHEVVGRNPRILKSDKHDKAFYQQMWAVLSRGEVWSGHLINRKKDGTLFEEKATISPIRDSTGQIINYVAVKYDVTYEVALEAQLRQSQKMDAIGHLAGGVAHDFNNLLTAIHGNASLLLDPQLQPEDAAECSQQILEAAERAAALTRQLLMFSRKQVMQPVTLELNDVVAQITKMLQRILGEDISLTSNYGTNLPAICADKGMMEQVILNLAVNARDAMPHGGRLIISTGAEMIKAGETGASPDAVPGSYVWLEVSDSGCGIPPEILPHIFEPFFTTKPVGQGTGLGLATVYGIAQQHHGWVTVNSRVNQGTTFRLYFPALAEAETQKTVGTKKSPLPRGSETILIVEDELPVRNMVNNLLKRCGYDTLQAESGVTAIKIWQEQKDRIHLVLTDIIMPDGMTGYDLSRQLRTEKPELKIIFTSGYSGDVVDDRLALIEGVNFLQKPFSPQKLAEILRDTLDRD